MNEPRRRCTLFRGNHLVSLAKGNLSIVSFSIDSVPSTSSTALASGPLGTVITLKRPLSRRVGIDSAAVTVDE